MLEESYAKVVLSAFPDKIKLCLCGMLITNQQEQYFVKICSCPQPRFKVWGGQNTFLGASSLFLLHAFTTNFLGTTKFGGHKVFASLPPNAILLDTVLDELLQVT